MKKMMFCSSFIFAQFGDILNKDKIEVKYIRVKNELSQEKIVKGLKKSLNVGVKLCIIKNGFYGDPKIKIPFPPYAKKILNGKYNAANNYLKKVFK